ncbi:thymidylate kinase-like [Dendronephthya gigantea]|uniref:thymidylate kinase-like n=1 Tax=Dendronephthya gigantea TaxID=151771 RepID=UPI00106A066C|nr:thymidylate kinase-like [Dendronephthya gigantea]
MAVARGAMIVFEGCDRCGKSTQCLKLVEYLRSAGRKVELFRFPDRSTAIGKTIDSYLQGRSELDDHAIHLMFSANRWEMKSKMKRLLEEGTTLVIDRYAYSGVAFTAAKHNFDLRWCKLPDSGLIAPDIVLYLDMPLEEAAKRGQYGGERYEKLEFQRRVSNIYSVLKEENWKVLNASKTIDDLHLDIKEIVENTINTSQNTKLKSLWPLTST